MADRGQDGRFADADFTVLGGVPTHDARTIPFEGGGTARLLYVLTPKSPPGGGCPVLYMLDGNAAIGCLDAKSLAQVPDLAIVAIGHGGAGAFDRARRHHDYTPPISPRDTAAPARPTGGAPALLADMVGPLRDTAERDLPVDPARRAVWGHSLGALFVLHAFFSRPDSFDAYIPVSPSLWMAGETIAELEAAAAPGARKRLLVMLGDMESRSGDPPLPRPRPAPATVALAERLSLHPALSVECRVLEGAQHGPALRRSVPYALRFAASAGVPE